MSSRYLSEALKKKIAGKQYFKCANKPGANIKGLKNYECLLWRSNDINGSFDVSGYEIDHIHEFSLSKNNNENNLQALCHSCHAYKTKDFIMNKPKIMDKENSEEIIKAKSKKSKKSKQSKKSKNKLYRISLEETDVPKYSYEIFYDIDELICKFDVTCHKNDDDPVFIEITAISLDHICKDKLYIIMTEIIKLIGAVYNNYIFEFRLDSVGDFFDDDMQYDVSKQISKQFIINFINGAKNITSDYDCFDTLTSDDNKHSIFISKKLIIHSVPQIKKNICDIFLLNSQVGQLLNQSQDSTKYDIGSDVFPHENSNTLFFQTYFSVSKEKLFEKTNKYSVININLYTPIQFYHPGGYYDDIYLKFIANGTDYTSDSGHLSGFSSDYRLNKLERDEKDYYVSNGGFYIIQRFSYYETNKDYKIAYGKDAPYPKLCIFIKRLYDNHK